MNTLHVKQGDMVMVLSGKDKGKKGKVLTVIPSAQKVVVEGINVATMHKKPRKQGEVGGIVKKEAPIYACKVAKFCSKCNKPTRQSVKVDGDKKKKVCTHCGAEF
jgi:large subunit ribosomal protein L24